MPNHKEFLASQIGGFKLFNWYFIIVNGTKHGFFKSERGLRQGGPISLALFILAAELLSKMLNDLHKKLGYKDFHMNGKEQELTTFHLWMTPFYFAMAARNL